jgi:hypothetical protein
MERTKPIQLILDFIDSDIKATILKACAEMPKDGSIAEMGKTLTERLSLAHPYRRWGIALVKKTSSEWNDSASVYIDMEARPNLEFVFDEHILFRVFELKSDNSILMERQNRVPSY